MIIDVIPIKKMPRQLSMLSYEVNSILAKKIKIGQIVKIPLRNSIVSGVVAKKNAKNKLRPSYLKNILEIINKKPLFTSEQINLFLALSEYYFVSASLFVYHSYPKMLKKEWQKIGTLKKTVRKKMCGTEYFWWGDLVERNKFYKKNIDKSGQTLIIVPRILEIGKMAKELELDKYCKVHGQLKRADNADIWNKGLSGEPGIYVGTRSAIFYPWTNLKAIIIDEEESIDHKQYDMNPRYDVRVVARKLVELSGGKLILSSNSPSVENYTKTLKHPIGQAYGADLSTKALKHIIIQDLKNELTKQNYTFISEKLEREIKKTIDDKKQVFLLINKKGESSNTFCKDCHYVFNCPECGLPLIKDSKNKFHCYYCNYQSELPPFCPKCAGPNIKSQGLGIQKIAKNLQKVFPDLEITKIDKSSGKSPSANCRLGVVIGTEFALHKIDWQKIGLAGIINADQLWQHTEFDTNQRAYGLINKILTLAPKSAKILIQTFSPDNSIIQSIYEGKPDIFYRQELNFRKNFNYPPFISLIKLSYLSESEDRAEELADKIYKKLKKMACGNIQISSPVPIMRRKIRGKYKFNIILKLKNLEDFNSLVKYVPNDWLIDVQSRTLLD
ncbi:MAG: primosomal protein N' [Candidatus Kuenenbacteria bacterium]